LEDLIEAARVTENEFRNFLSRVVDETSLREGSNVISIVTPLKDPVRVAEKARDSYYDLDQIRRLAGLFLRYLGEYDIALRLLGRALDLQVKAKPDLDLLLCRIKRLALHT
jgi:hypothetical protein